MSTATPSVVRAFNAISRVYDNPLLQRVAYRANHDAVLAALRRHGARRVVDVGCGTGILAARIQRELDPELVYGCDPSAGMLEKGANGRAPSNGSGARPSSSRLTTERSTRSRPRRRFSSSTNPRR